MSAASTCARDRGSSHRRPWVMTPRAVRTGRPLRSRSLARSPNSSAVAVATRVRSRSGAWSRPGALLLRAPAAHFLGPCCSGRNKSTRNARPDRPGPHRGRPRGRNVAAGASERRKAGPEASPEPRIPRFVAPTATRAGPGHRMGVGSRGGDRGTRRRPSACGVAAGDLPCGRPLERLRGCGAALSRSGATVRRRACPRSVRSRRSSGS